MRVLFVAARYPWPPRRGDQMRAVQFVEALASQHEVVLLAPRPRGGQPGGSDGHQAAPSDRFERSGRVRVVLYRRSWLDPAIGLVRAAIRGEPWQSAAFYSRDLRRELRRWKERSDLAILQLVRLCQHIEDLEGSPILVDLIDALSLSFARRARHDALWRRGLWLWESRRLQAAEVRVLQKARGACVVCQRDAAYLRRRMPETFAERLRVIPLVCSPAPSRHTASSAGSVPEDAQQTVVMTGNLGYFPNQEGASWFLREVWPQLRSARSEVRLLLAGTRPTGALVRLAARHDVGLRASPRRLVAALEIADVAVAPIFSGAGIPVKVLEAWAHRVPVVASRWAADGAGASDGVDVLCAGSPSEWVSAILRLLDDRTLQQDLSRAGVERLRQWHSAERLNRELGEWIVAPSLTGHKDD